MSAGQVAGAIGRGLVAGFVGAAAMTVSSTLEAKWSGRGASTVPADAVEEVAGVEPTGEAQEQRLNQLAHWGYGTGLGSLRGLIGAAGLSGPAAAFAHFITVWGGQQVELPALGVAAPTWRYGGKALGVDLAHHAVYAAATSLAYEWLDRR